MSARRESAGDTAAVAGGATVVGAKRWWSLVALCLSAAIVWFAAANIPVATSAISADIGGSVTALQWVNTIFTLVCGALVIAAWASSGSWPGARRTLMRARAFGTSALAAPSTAGASMPITLIAGLP